MNMRNESRGAVRRLAALTAMVILQSCTSNAGDVDGAFHAFVRSCEPDTLRADTFDQADGMRTLTVTCRVVRR